MKIYFKDMEKGSRYLIEFVGGYCDGRRILHEQLPKGFDVLTDPRREPLGLKQVIVAARVEKYEFSHRKKISLNDTIFYYKLTH